MSNKYYTLCTFEYDDEWYPQFGDFDPEIVEEELQDYKELGYKAKHLKIVRSDADQDSINQAVADLNSKRV